MMEKKNKKDTNSLIGPNISSTFPICDLSLRKTGALKYGIFSFEHLHIKSSSHGCIYSPSSKMLNFIIFVNPGLACFHKQAKIDQNTLATA